MILFLVESPARRIGTRVSADNDLFTGRGTICYAVLTMHEIIIDCSFRQKLIPRKFSVDELFDDCTRVLE